MSRDRKTSELVLLRNLVHGTQYVTRLRPGKNVVTEAQSRQWKAALCGREGCQCSTFAGVCGAPAPKGSHWGPVDYPITVWDTGEECEFGCAVEDGLLSWVIYVPEDEPDEGLTTVLLHSRMFVARLGGIARDSGHLLCGLCWRSTALNAEMVFLT
jgi:hypothetical protein